MKSLDKKSFKVAEFFSTTQTSTKSAFLHRIAISSFYDGCTFDLLNKVIIFAICRNLFQVFVKVFHAYYSDQIWLLISPLFKNGEEIQTRDLQDC